jgi:hypothetical protein
LDQEDSRTHDACGFIATASGSFWLTSQNPSPRLPTLMMTILMRFVMELNSFLQRTEEWPGGLQVRQS